uniref:Uncharacterized protein n=1 Tax=Meloidogyne javanica TaxID=6303 RepID=A0A915LPD2_MELJA
MTYNHQANNSGSKSFHTKRSPSLSTKLSFITGKKSKIVSPTQHPSNSSFNLNPTSGKTDQNGDIEMVSANNTTEHLPVTPPKGSQKKSERPKRSQFQTHSSEYKSNQFADSKQERNQQKLHSVYGKPPDTVNTLSSEQYNSGMDFENSN